MDTRQNISRRGEGDSRGASGRAKWWRRVLLEGCSGAESAVVRRGFSGQRRFSFPPDKRLRKPPVISLPRRSFSGAGVKHRPIPGNPRIGCGQASWRPLPDFRDKSSGFSGSGSLKPDFIYGYQTKYLAPRRGGFGERVAGRNGGGVSCLSLPVHKLFTLC